MLNSDRIDPDTSLGHVHLTVADLESQLYFYQNILGLQLHRREDDTAALGVGGPDLLRLTELPKARGVSGTTGLYHFAILLPGRRELAQVLARLLSQGYPNSPTDHLFTKSVYLSDPEGNGIEVYAESPEDGSFTVVDNSAVVRDSGGVPRPAVAPLDVEGLMGHLHPGDSPQTPLPQSAKIGHVNLHVTDLDAATRFYCGPLGFDNRGRIDSMGLALVAAGDYRHHIALNTWQGPATPPPDAAGLRHFTIRLPRKSALVLMLERLRHAGITAEPLVEGVFVRDPSQNGVLFTA